MHTTTTTLYIILFAILGFQIAAHPLNTANGISEMLDNLEAIPSLTTTTAPSQTLEPTSTFAPDTPPTFYIGTNSANKTLPKFVLDDSTPSPSPTIDSIFPPRSNASEDKEGYTGADGYGDWITPATYTMVFYDLVLVGAWVVWWCAGGFVRRSREERVRRREERVERGVEGEMRRLGMI